jgi:arginyl-tRNA synthetase
MSVDIRGTIARQLSAAIDVPSERVASLLEIPPSVEFGDFALPCFTLAREYRKKPADIALDLAGRIGGERGKPGILSRAESKGPYLNLFLNREMVTGQILKNLYGSDFSALQAVGKGKPVVIDYSSPNIAKPFGIGHLRSTVIGNALRNVYQFIGYHVIGINHLGDWGTQFGKLIVAFKRWGSTEALEAGDPILYLYKLYVRFHAEAEKDSSLDDEARVWFNRLELGDPEARKLWQEFREHSLDEFRRIYERLGVQFAYYTGESFYGDLLEETVERIVQSGVTEMSEGALTVPLDDEDLPPALIRKSDGSTLYLTRDLAAVFYRFELFHFELALYVVGTPQSLHFRQLFGVLEKMELTWWERCHHVPFGQIRFKDGSMSTRKGNIIFLEEVLDRAVRLALEKIGEKNPTLRDKERVAESVGVGAVIFNDLKNSRINDIAFDWDEIINFNGETGVYLQYTHARSCSLLKKYAGRYGELSNVEGCKGGAEGYPIAFRLNEFEKTVQRAAQEFEPSILARYLLDLASEFNSFYNHHRVITAHVERSRSRALIVFCVRKVLRQGLELLGIDAIEEM